MYKPPFDPIRYLLFIGLESSCPHINRIVSPERRLGAPEHSLEEEFTGLAETRLAQNTLSYLAIAFIT